MPALDRRNPFEQPRPPRLAEPGLNGPLLDMNNLNANGIQAPDGDINVVLEGILELINFRGISLFYSFIAPLLSFLKVLLTTFLFMRMIMISFIAVPIEVGYYTEYGLKKLYSFLDYNLYSNLEKWMVSFMIHSKQKNPIIEPIAIELAKLIKPLENITMIQTSTLLNTTTSVANEAIHPTTTLFSLKSFAPLLLGYIVILAVYILVRLIQ